MCLFGKKDRWVEAHAQLFGAKDPGKGQEFFGSGGY
jgi:hypothetical protein